MQRRPQSYVRDMKLSRLAPGMVPPSYYWSEVREWPSARGPHGDSAREQTVLQEDMLPFHRVLECPYEDMR